MFNKTQSLSIYRPKTLNEFSKIAQGAKDIIIFARGSHLMRDENFANISSPLVDINNIIELTKLSRNDQKIEIGSMLSLSDLLNNTRSFLPDILIDCISNISTNFLRERSSLGGSLATKDIRLSLAGALIALDAKIEIRNPNNTNTIKNVADLYATNGSLNLEQNRLITKISFNLDQGSYQYYKNIDSVYKPDAISFAFIANLNQNKLQNVKLCVSFPKIGHFNMYEFSTLLNNQIFPISKSDMKEFGSILKEHLLLRYNLLSSLALQRAKNCLFDNLSKINIRVLENNE